MKVTDLHSFFVDACYPLNLEECFTKSADAERIRRNKTPLTMEHQTSFAVKQHPFSFSDVFDVVFGSFGNVLLIDKSETEYRALRPCDSTDACLKLLSVNVDRAIYRLPYAAFVGNANRSIGIPNVRAYGAEVNLRRMFEETRYFDVGNDVLSYQRTQLASFFFDVLDEPDEFYFSLLSGRYRCVNDDSTSTSTSTMRRVEKTLGVAYSTSDDRVLFPIVRDDDAFFVKGCPVKRKSFFRSVETGKYAIPSGETLDYRIVLSDGLTVSLPASNRKLSVVISYLCHLERFGHFPNEREIALEYQKQLTSIKHEETVAKLRRSWHVDDRRALPWTELNDRKSYGDLRRSFDGSKTNAKNGNALSGLTEEIPTSIDSPFDALKWNVDDACFYQGESFVRQFYTIDWNASGLKRDESMTFLSIAYAFLSGTMSDDSFNSIELEYGRTRPSLDSYEWYLTNDGVLYYSRLKRRSNEIAQRNASIEEDENEHDRGNVAATNGNVVERAQPCFLEDIDMDVENEGEEELNGSIVTSKPWTGKYTNENKVKDRFYKNGDVLTTRRSPTIRNDNDDASSHAFEGIREEGGGCNGSFYDPCVLRKYDGKGLFPVLASMKELETKKESNSIAFDSDRLSNGPFRLHDCFDDNDVTHVNDAARFGNEDDIPHRMVEMIDFTAFFLQYTEQTSDIFSDADCSDDDDDEDEDVGLSEYMDYELNNARRVKRKRERSYEPIVRHASVRCIDHAFVCDEIIRTLIPRNATLKEGVEYQDANPLWMQCCTFVCSKQFKVRTICLTYNNVPKSIDNVYFVMQYHQIRCLPNFAMCLGYVSPEEGRFKYDVFDCVVDVDRVTNLPSKYFIYKVTQTDDSDRISITNNGKNVKRHLCITKSLISISRFNNILDASVLFVINSGF